MPNPPVAMYSGSASWAKGVPGQAMRNSPKRGTPPRVAVLTLDSASSLSISITVTVPSGSGVPLSSASPSLATRRCFPPAVKVSMSGSAPAGSVPRRSPSVSKKTTLPGSVFGSASTATATSPRSLTSTLFGPPPKGDRSTDSSSMGAVGSEKS